MDEFILDNPEGPSERLHNKALELVRVGNSSEHISLRDGCHRAAQVYATLSVAAAMREG